MQEQWLGNFVLNDDDEPIRAGTLMGWALWMETNPGRCQVALDKIGPATVSTVFLGVDMAFAMSLRLNPETQRLPRLWETMVFDDLGGPYDQYQKRYTAKAEALEGHKKVVQMLTS